MRVGVDEARCYQPLGRINGPRHGVCRPQLVTIANRYDAISMHGDRRPFEKTPIPILGEDETRALNDRIDGFDCHPTSRIRIREPAIVRSGMPDPRPALA